MKRVLKVLAALALAHPKAVIAGSVMLMGVGGVVVNSMLTTPANVPQPTAFFSNGNGAAVNNGLKPPTGAFQPPTVTTHSMGVFLDGSVSAGTGFGFGDQYALGGYGGVFEGLQISDNAAGLPAFFFQKPYPSGGAPAWWQVGGFNLNDTSATDGGAVGNYTPGYYPFTATGGLCAAGGAREPSGVFGGTNNTSQVGGVHITDPGFLLCSVPTITLAAIPNSGAQQATGAGSVATTCVNNSPVSGRMTVTAQVAVAHGITAGQTYPLSGFAQTGFNSAAYIAQPPTSPTTLIGSIVGTCPSLTATSEGSALGGTGATITLPAFTTIGATGITAKNNQHFCAAIIENGDDSSFPGSQAIAMVDDHGNPLPGSPALVPYLNQGSANFTGYTVTGAQSTGNVALTVTAMNPYTITGATYSATTGYVTFTTSTPPMFEPGSEFTVSGMTSTGASINLTYVAVAGTSITGTSIVGNPLSAPFGTPLAISSPGTISTGVTPQMVSVIMPGMRIQGQFLTTTLGVISPFGTLGSTGTGGVGTYAVSATPILISPFGLTIPSTGVMTAAGLTTQTLAIGTNFNGSDGAGATSIQITGFGTGTGLNGTYQTNYTGGVGGTHSFVTTGINGIGTPSSPALLFAVNPFYQTMAGIAGTLPGSPSTAFTTVPVAQATIGEFATSIGTDNTTRAGSPAANTGGWSGTLANVADLWMPGGFPTQTGGAPSTSALAGLCKKNPNNDIQQFASTRGFTVHSDYRLNDPGIFADSSVAQFTASISGTTLTVSSTQTGALTGSGTATIGGAGVPGCPSACPTITLGAGPTYTISGAGGTVASEAMTAGTFVPAVPTPTSAVNGFISGNTLTVTSVGSSSPNTTATFTGSLNVPFTAKINNGSGAAGNILTVTLPVVGNGGLQVNPYIGVGTTISGAGVTSSPATVVTGLLTGLGANGTYTVNNSQTVTSETMHASGLLPGLATNLTVSGVTGTIASGMLITDGGVNITGPPLLVTAAAVSGDVAIAPTYYPTFSGDTTMVGTLSTLVPGQYVLNSGITTPVKIIGYGTGTGLTGTYILSNSTNGSIGSSGSPVAFTTTGITDGAPVPTPALTVKDLGAGATLPVTSNLSACTFASCSGTGTIPLSGTFDISALSGTPTTLQAQVSETAGGPPVAGCSACAWTTLSGYSANPLTLNASISTGGVMSPTAVGAPVLGIGQAVTGVGYSGTVTGINYGGQLPTYNVTPSPGSAIAAETITATNVFSWLGSALNIPASSGSLYVSVRASNGTAYAMLQNAVRIGFVLEGEGEGQYATLFSPSQGGNAFSSFTGLLGANGVGNEFFQAGPPIVGALIPGSGLTTMDTEDRFNIAGRGTPEGSTSVQQGLTTATGGWPVTWLSIPRDGIGIEPELYGNSTQTQTVGVQNSGGTLTKWCSQAIFCTNPSVAGVLLFNAASLSGGEITAKIDNGSGGAGNTLTTSVGARSSAYFGALEPGMVLTDTTSAIAGSPTLLNCLTGCAPITSTPPTIPQYCVGKCYPNIQTWAISGSAQLVSTENMRADFPQTGGTPWPLYTGQVFYPFFSTFGATLVKAGTFKISVNGTVVCQDTTVPLTPYNNQSGNCTGAGIASSFVNFMTGDYQVTFSSPPAANAVVTASWTNIISPDNGNLSSERPGAYDLFGDGTPNVGYVTSLYSKSPGGVSAHIFAGGQGVQTVLRDQGYPFALGYSQAVSWLYDTRFPTIPGVSANAPVLFGHVWGVQGPALLNNSVPGQTAEGNLFSQWIHDVATSSTFSGTVGGVSGGGATATLTLSGAASGPMWEGEVIGCAPFSLTAAPSRDRNLHSIFSKRSAWGASGSTYITSSRSAARPLLQH